MKLSLRCLPLLTALLLPLAGAAAGTADAPAQRHAAALAEYEACHWAQAYQAFTALADEGHQPSARVALLMSAHGYRLYGQVFEASAGQRQRWAALPMPAAEAQLFAAVRSAQPR